jgi:hypothetical protein
MAKVNLEYLLYSNKCTVVPVHAMQVYEGTVEWLHSFLTSAREEPDGELYVTAALPP